MHFWIMASPNLKCGFGGTIFFAKQDDFRVRMRELPAVDGIALNDAIVSGERFACGKTNNHRRLWSRPSFLAVLPLGSRHLFQDRIKTPSQATQAAEKVGFSQPNRSESV